MRPAPAYGPSWFEQLRDWPISDVAARFGLEVERRGASVSAKPCPLCSDETRHHKSKDRRGALGLRPDGTGWRCFQCEVTGDGTALAAACVLGTTRPAKELWPEVRRACAERGLCEPDPHDTRPAPPIRFVPPPSRKKPSEAPERPPRVEVLALWNTGTRVDLAAASERPEDREAAAYVAGRGLNLGDLALWEPDLCRILPGSDTFAFPTWWPEAWASCWRWAVLAYEPNGEVGSIHARAIGDAKPKTRWPKGCAAGGLMFANARGAAFLRGDASAVDSMQVVEGLSDFVSASLWVHRTGRCRAVLGVTSGAAKALEHVRWPEHVTCYVGTDNDKDGDRYAAEVRAALSARVTVKRQNIKGAP